MRLGAIALALSAFAGAVASGQRLKVEHAMSIEGGKPHYTTRGTLNYGADSASFDQVPLTDAEAAALKVRLKHCFMAVRATPRLCSSFSLSTPDTEERQRVNARVLSMAPSPPTTLSGFVYPAYEPMTCID